MRDSLHVNAALHVVSVRQLPTLDCHASGRAAAALGHRNNADALRGATLLAAENFAAVMADLCRDSAAAQDQISRVFKQTSPWCLLGQLARKC